MQRFDIRITAEIPQIIIEEYNEINKKTGLSYEFEFWLQENYGLPSDFMETPSSRIGKAVGVHKEINR